MKKYLEDAAGRVELYAKDNITVRLIIVVDGVKVSMRRGAYVYDYIVPWETIEHAQTNPITDRMYMARRVLERLR